MQQAFEYLLQVLSDSTKVISFDMETTGLNPRTSKAFMCSFAWSEDGKDHTATWFFDGTPADKELMRALCTKPKTILAHNAKFEMGFLYEQFGLFVDVPIWDTMVMARVQFNNHMSYSLEKCGERINAPKIDLKKYMDEHGMVSGRAPNKVYHYDRVPRDVITEYCENDALVSLLLYKSQVATFREWESVGPSVAAVVRLELATTKNLFEMERRGLRLDQRLCHEAYSYEQGRALAAHSWLSRYMERPFVDSANELLDPMLAEGIQPSHTEKGGLSFDSETLASKTSEFTCQVLAHRDASKRATTYFGNFLELLSPNGRIHPSIFQVGAASGRFSVRDPSCQNWPDDWGKDGWTTPYPVRRVFIPDDGCRIVSFDYAAMELRVMADEADEMQLIHDIQNGVDFHQKLADSASITRGVAKAARFSSLYGAGHKKLAKILSLPESKAKSILDELRLQTPNITMYSRRLIKYAETNGCATNWLGRRYFFDSKFAYKFPNYRIQGGCSEILRFAIDSVTKFVSAHRKGNTYLMLPIHDELVLNVDGGDMGLLPTIRVLMIEAYKAKKHLDMDVACAVGNNFADVEAYSLESTAGKTL